MSEFPECTNTTRFADLLGAIEGLIQGSRGYRSIAVFATYPCDKDGHGYHVTSAAEIEAPIARQDARSLINRMREVTNELERKLLPDEVREIIIPWPPESLG